MKKITGLALLCLFLVSTSCKKEGCTTSYALNYDAEANDDNGSCLYEGKVSFWFDQSESNQLVFEYGVTELNVFIDEKLSGTMDPSEWKIGPDCDGGNFTVTVSLGNLESKDLQYYVRSQGGIELYSGNFSCGAVDCINVELD